MLVGLAPIACICAATAIGQLAKHSGPRRDVHVRCELSRAFEILIFGVLALWMIFSKTGRLNLLALARPDKIEDVKHVYVEDDSEPGDAAPNPA